MNNNTLPLVTYNQARRLKKAGFDWNHSQSGCRWYYPEPNSNNVKLMEVPFTMSAIAAPTVALALKWLRDVKGIVGNVICRYEKCDEVYSNEVFVGDGWNESQDFSNYETAESALLDELLKLIKNGKE